MRHFTQGRRSPTRWAILMSAAVALAGCSPLTAAQPSPAPSSPQPLLDQQVAGEGGAFRVSVDREVYPAHYAGLWHTHPGPGSFCVVQGSLRVEAQDQASIDLTPGQCWAEPENVPHRPVNITSTEAVAIFFLLAPAGAPGIRAATPSASPS